MMLYRLLKKIYWKLPREVRGVLHPLKNRISYLIRSMGGGRLYTPFSFGMLKGGKDLSWQQFNENILSFRHRYKGIFIQEVVIDWGVPLYQRPQHISVALGKLGYLVLYRTVNLTNDDVSGFRQVAPNVWLTNSPHIDSIPNVVHSFYSTAFSLSSDRIGEIGNYSTIVYEYIDHIDSEISGNDENIKRLIDLQQKCFAGSADYVVASARRLEEEAKRCFVTPENVVLIPNGVDVHHYRNPIHQSYELPRSMTEFRNKYKKIVGYFGAIAPWLWYEVIERLVSLRSDIGFIFIGPDYYGGAEQLPKAENILYVGTVDYKVLPAYAKEFDVCFIPFKPGDIAKTTSPLKLFEYFALQKPVVVTSDMLECIAFKEVLHANTAEELSKRFDSALELAKDDDFKRRMFELADENSWDARVRFFECLFQQNKSVEETHG